MIRLIFILPNIYEITNGVSKKYISFLEYLSQQKSIHVSVFLTKTKKSSFLFPKLPNIHFHLVKGMRVPYYREIKVPFPSYSEISQHILTGDEIILFHGEFFWLYDSMEKLYFKWKQEKKLLRIFVNWHTDYEYYLQYSYKNTSFLPILNIDSFIQRLYQLLEKKIFHGIVVTGSLMMYKFSPYTSHLFNANEIDLSIYHKYKFDLCDGIPNSLHEISSQVLTQDFLKKNEKVSMHGFYCGRMSREKNIDMIPSYLFLLQKTLQIPIHMHMIGGGPDLESFKQKVDSSIQYHFYGSISSEEIFQLYMRFPFRFFLFCSTSETFGKSPFEAAACGIPVFIIESRITKELYIHQQNAFIFQDIDSFITSFLTYWNWNTSQKERFLLQSFLNTQPYQQTKILHDWYHFLTKNDIIEKKNGWFQTLTFKSIAQTIQCSGDLFAEK